MLSIDQVANSATPNMAKKEDSTKPKSSNFTPHIINRDTRPILLIPMLLYLTISLVLEVFKSLIFPTFLIAFVLINLKINNNG